MTVRPDTFVKVEIGELETLDPAYPYDTRSWEVMANVYDTLFAYSRQRRAFLPRLAREVPTVANGLISPDGRTYRIPIRSGVSFHGGEQLTPSDVAYSLRRLLLHHRARGPAWMLLEPLQGDAADRADLAAAINRIQTDGEHVVITLAQPFAPLLAVLTTPATSVLSQSWASRHGEWSGASPEPGTGKPFTESYLHTHMNGTGPYRFVEWRPDTEVRLARFDEHWDGRPALAHAVLLKENDWPRRRELLTSGEADMVQTDRTHIPQIAELPGVTVYDDLPLDVCDTISFQFDIDTVDNPHVGSGRLDGDGIPADFFTDVHVRRGFSYCFDWARVIRDIHLDKAVQLRGPIPSGLPVAGPSPSVYEFDLAAAERELRQAWQGRLWETGFRCTGLFNEGNSLREGWMRVLADGLRAVNERFRLAVAPIDLAETRRAMASRRLPLYTVGWLVDYPDPHNFAQPTMASYGHLASLQGYRNPAVDELVRTGLTQLDPDRRRDTYRRLQEHAYADAKDIYTVEPLGLAVLRDWVKGWEYDRITGPQAITLVGDLSKVES
jgi:peptide/nickel transport system substrate-binding protein